MTGENVVRLDTLLDANGQPVIAFGPNLAAILVVRRDGTSQILVRDEYPVAQFAQALIATAVETLKQAGHIRDPYVGQGIDGCRRSAQIDREEADLADDPDTRTRLHASARMWEAQADALAQATEGL